MRIEVTKKHLIVFGIITLIFSIAGAFAIGFGHNVNEIDWSQMINANVTVSGYVASNIVVANSIGANNSLCIGNDCITSWPSGDGGGVTKIIAGDSITVTPTEGTGEVTIRALIPVDEWTKIENNVLLRMIEPDTRVGIGIAGRNPTERLEVAGNVKADGFCIKDDCKTAWPVYGNVYKRAKTEYCGGTAFLCFIAGSGGAETFDASPFWDSKKWYDKSTTGRIECSWILCTQ